MTSQLYEKICGEQQRLSSKIASIDQQLQQFPEGKLVCTHNGKYLKYFRSDGHHTTYIPRKNQALVQQLAVKKYLSLQKEDLLQEQKALESYLLHHSTDQLAQQFLQDQSEFTPLLTTFFQPAISEHQEWMHTPYQQNSLYPEQRIHKTSAGIQVRSKSEAMIVTFLHMYKIAFRYECALELGDTLIFPDFTILHPQTSQLLYWEHFGLMDQPDYSKNAFAKLQRYAEHGLYPSIQLITTYETKQHPLGSDTIEATIQQYLL